jgi:hypothetical protein
MRIRDDLACSTFLVALVLVYASIAGNTLYLGPRYIIGVSVILLLPGLMLRARALFLTGTTAAAMVTLLLYMAIVTRAGREGGLVGLGHVFAAPGMFLGAGVAAWLLRGRIHASLPWVVAALGFLGGGLGFILAQLIVCNTPMYCGVLSFAT